MEKTVFKKIREKLGISQSEFAKSIGLEQGSYSGLESGKKGSLTKQTALLLKYTHGINMDYLYGISGEMFENNTSKIPLEENLKLDINIEAKDIIISALTEKVRKLQNENLDLRKKLGIEERSA